MNWTDEEIESGRAVGRSSGAVAVVTSPEGVAAIMTRGVELARARGGTTAAEKLEDAFDAIRQGLDPEGPCTCGSDPDGYCRPCGQAIWGQKCLDLIEKHATAQGVTVATLQTRVEGLERQLTHEVQHRAALDAEYHEATRERDALQEKLKACESTLADAETREAMLEAENQRLQAKARNLEQELSKERAAHELEKRTHERTWDRKKQHIDERDVARLQLEEREGIIAGFREREATYKQAIEQLHAEAERLTAELGMRVGANAMMEAALRAETAARRSTESRLVAIQERIESLRMSLDSGDLGMTEEAASELISHVEDLEAALEGDAPQEVKDEPRATLVNVTVTGRTLVASERGITGLDGTPPEGKACAWGGGKCVNAAPSPCGLCNSRCGHALGICAGFGYYPCSPTCTHEAAKNPDHPERVRALRERMPESPDVIDSGDDPECTYGASLERTRTSVSATELQQEASNIADYTSDYPQIHPHPFTDNGRGACSWHHLGPPHWCGYPEKAHEKKS